MTDPLNDPRFPDRPTHPDFWRISESVLQLDGKADEGAQSFDTIVYPLVDVRSLGYMAHQRALRMGTGFVSETLYLDGFLAGVLFQQKGGHRDE